jgi:hypothetical protein
MHRTTPTDMRSAMQLERQLFFCELHNQDARLPILAYKGA